MLKLQSKFFCFSFFYHICESSIANSHLNHRRALQLQSADIAQATRGSYPEIYALLRDKLEKSSGGQTKDAHWRPQLTGLECVTSRCDGSTAWVLKNEHTIAEFHQLGKQALVI